MAKLNLTVEDGIEILCKKGSFAKKTFGAGLSGMELLEISRQESVYGYSDQVIERNVNRRNDRVIMYVSRNGFGYARDGFTPLGLSGAGATDGLVSLKESLLTLDDQLRKNAKIDRNSVIASNKGREAVNALATSLVRKYPGLNFKYIVQGDLEKVDQNGTGYLGQKGVSRATTLAKFGIDSSDSVMIILRRAENIITSAPIGVIFYGTNPVLDRTVDITHTSPDVYVSDRPGFDYYVRSKGDLVNIPKGIDMARTWDTTTPESTGSKPFTGVVGVPNSDPEYLGELAPGVHAWSLYGLGLNEAVKTVDVVGAVSMTEKGQLLVDTTHVIYGYPGSSVAEALDDGNMDVETKAKLSAVNCRTVAYVARDFQAPSDPGTLTSVYAYVKKKGKSKGVKKLNESVIINDTDSGVVKTYRQASDTAANWRAQMLHFMSIRSASEDSVLTVDETVVEGESVITYSVTGDDDVFDDELDGSDLYYQFLIGGTIVNNTSKSILDLINAGLESDDEPITSIDQLQTPEGEFSEVELVESTRWNLDSHPLAKKAAVSMILASSNREPLGQFLMASLQFTLAATKSAKIKCMDGEVKSKIASIL